MYKLFFGLTLISIFIFVPASNSNNNTSSQKPARKITAPTMSETELLYEEMNLKEFIGQEMFEQAMAGYKAINPKNKTIITLIDFTKPSTQERLFVLDLENKTILFASHVAHGRGSGENYATSFSNRKNSHKSSLGFYLTENTYNGKNGYSLIINGLEKGINDNAKARSVVIHAADYCEPSYMESNGRLGRSWGCPALPPDINDAVIDVIKDGSLLFIYADNKEYLAFSPIISNAKLYT
ncbi:hypothetical protein M2132_000421 [Dysgonomonas sp. PH5-45]|uniref:murein L,D-transpeptidase catalytic domain family protein n=1 Tax=unclassified Dysgonomonas TaxID=2630389 RepID=UPI00247E8890|nr:hypothetical protein [Dysgonomonas sp. PH5-45]MDH6387050.1 hypothetical protein [Dysgonomonas sp. PH5-37]